MKGENSGHKVCLSMGSVLLRKERGEGGRHRQVGSTKADLKKILEKNNLES